MKVDMEKIKKCAFERKARHNPRSLEHGQDELCKSTDSLPRRTPQQTAGVLQKGIRFIVLFGSQTVGNRRENSDFDVAVLTTKEKNISIIKNYIEILDFLSNLLGIPDYRIDLTNLNKANPFLKSEVISSGKLLYGDEDEYADYMADAFKDYIDSQPLFQLEKYLIKKRQNLLGELLVQQK